METTSNTWPNVNDRSIPASTKGLSDPVRRLAFGMSLANREIVKRMEFFDAIIVGGGPAGSTCAWALRRAGLKVCVADRAVFPRDKVCAGWITPPVIDALELDVEEYRQGRVFQPITAFRTSVLPET